MVRDSQFLQVSRAKEPTIRDLAPIVWIAAIIAITVASPRAWVLDNLWLEHLANCVALGPSLIGGSTAALMALAIRGT